jgi:hypothetical protein
MYNVKQNMVKYRTGAKEEGDTPGSNFHQLKTLKGDQRFLPVIEDNLLGEQEIDEDALNFEDSQDDQQLKQFLKDENLPDLPVIQGEDLDVTRVDNNNTVLEDKKRVPKSSLPEIGRRFKRKQLTAE